MRACFVYLSAVLACLATGSASAGSLCDEAELFSNGFHAARTRTACELKEAIESRYALAYQKEKRIANADGSPFRTGRHLEACVAEEYGTPDDDFPEAQLAFYDRMRACIAGFQDTHLEIAPTVEMPWVSLGFSMGEVNGAFYIDTLYPRVLADKAARLGDPRIPLRLVRGARILSLDGRAIEQRLAELKPSISGSSERYRRMETLNRLTSRGFAYPASAIARIEVANSNGEDPVVLELPWSADLGSRLNPNARAVLEARGFRHDPLLPWIEERDGTPAEFAALTTLPRYDGYYDETPAVPASAASRLKTFLGANSGEPALAFVRVEAGRDSVEDSYCYLQLASFGDNRIPSLLGKFSRNYAAPMRSFLGKCRRQKLPLVLDLRTNPGGYLQLGMDTVSSLTPKGAVHPARETFAYREDSVYREIDSAYFDGQYWGQNSIEGSPRVSSRPGAYDGKIVALITPYCISSCDRLSALLKAGRRATFLGSPTNGTGAGFLDETNPDTGQPISNWSDSGSIFSLQIPDMLFGAMPDSSPLARSRPSQPLDWWRWLREGRPEDGAWYDLSTYEDAALIENRPTQPDVLFEPSVSDLAGSTQGWIDAIEKLL